jgi:hypothetical protein
MHNLLRCRRGSAAFATVIALVPLIGVVSLGGEAGSWYVTKQHAQNAADSAATSGALTIALQIAASLLPPGVPPVITDLQTYDYRGKQFAAQNAFCNAGDTSYPGSLCATTLPTGISQTVDVKRGIWAANVWTDSLTGSFVRATVSQQQPTYLAKLLGLSTVNIPTQAIAQVQSDDTKQLCGVGLGRHSGGGSPTSSLLFAGNEALSGNGCGFQSNNTVKYASPPTFNGTGWAVYASTGCVNSGTCDPGVPFNYSMLPVVDPLPAKLDPLFTTFSGSRNPCPPSSNVSNGNVTSGKNCPIAPNTPTTAYGNLTVHAGSIPGTATFQTGGTFFFNNASLDFSGTVTGTNVNIVLLGNSKLSITGNVNLSANFSNTTYPALNGVLIDDQACRGSLNPCPSLQVTINGGAGVTIALGGTMYFPNVDVTMSGNSQNANTACTEVIANSITFSGGTGYLSTQSCDVGGNNTPRAQVVALVL